MFCKNCGKEIEDNAKFCTGCGTIQGETQQIANTAIQEPSKKSKSKKIIGIIMLVLGGLSVLGSFANDYYWNITHNGLNMSDIITVGIQLALIILGIYFIAKSKK